MAVPNTPADDAPVGVSTPLSHRPAPPARSGTCSSTRQSPTSPRAYLWWALTFWVYLETRSVLATGIIGGAYMLLVALCLDGLRHDRRPPSQAPRHGVRGRLHRSSRSRSAPGLFAASTSRLSSISAGRCSGSSAASSSFGAVVENMRNIALSTVVTLLIPTERHANANGLVGTVQGIAFMVTSVFSGLVDRAARHGFDAHHRDRALGGRAHPPALPAHPRRRAEARRPGARSSTCAAASPRCARRPGSSRSSSSRRSTTSSAASTWRSWTPTVSSSSRSNGGGSCSESRRPGSSSAGCSSRSSGSARTRSARCCCSSS